MSLSQRWSGAFITNVLKLERTPNATVIAFGLEKPGRLKALVEGLILADYSLDDFKTGEAADTPKIDTISIVLPDDRDGNTSELKRGQTIAESVNF